MRRSPRKSGRSSPVGLAWLIIFLAALMIAAIGAVAAYTRPQRAEPVPAARAAASARPSGTSEAGTNGGAPSPSASPSASPDDDSVSIVTGGDVMGDRRVAATIRSSGADAVLSGIAPVLRRADLAFVNVESPLSDRGSPQAWKDVTFRGHPDLASALGRAGLDVATMANNHAMDYGDEALLDAIRRLRKADVEVVGAGKDRVAAWRPALIQRDGVTVAFLGFSDILPPGYVADAGPGIAAARVDAAAMTKAVAAASKKADYVVASFHWGVELARTPVAAQIQEAHAAVDAGADLVIGHHPHVLQGFEKYHGAIIAYSLGDLVFDHYSVETGETVLVQAVLSPRQIAVTLLPVYLSDSGVPAVVKGGEAATILARVRQLSADRGTRVSVHGSRATITVKRRT